MNIDDIYKMSDERAIELSKQAIKPCKGITLHALEQVIKLAEKYVDEHISFEKVQQILDKYEKEV